MGLTAPPPLLHATLSLEISPVNSVISEFDWPGDWLEREAVVNAAAAAAGDWGDGGTGSAAVNDCRAVVCGEG